MAMREQDLEQLEQYLDGALEANAVSQLQNRLGSDAELAAALTELKAQRALRSAVWQSIDPDMTSAERLVWRIKGAMLDHERTVAIKPRKMWGSWRISSVSSAAAACLILGFMFGRVGHNPSQPPVGMPTGIASSDSHNSTLIHYTAPGQSSAPTQLIASNPKPKISVPITDEYGQVVAWQTFDNAEDAKSFTEDLHKTHAQQSAPALTSPPRLVDQQQF